jgi:hypothetical protein
MAIVAYRVVQHDGGWAYKFDGVFSETFRTRSAAVRAAKRVAQEQRAPGETAEIQYEDANGVWRSEHVEGRDRPTTEVIE